MANLLRMKTDKNVSYQIYKYILNYNKGILHNYCKKSVKFTTPAFCNHGI